jgi:ribosomal protein S18 acetylase RimI-like enzyme
MTIDIEHLVSNIQHPASSIQYPESRIHHPSPMAPNQHSGESPKMKTAIRPYHPSDLVSLYQICLSTGKSGQNASDLYKDPQLLGQFYAAPYAVLEPELCFILTLSGKPAGYILGTKDSLRFEKKCEEEWFPVLREKYPVPAQDDDSLDARIIRLIHTGHKAKPELVSYPAHLHIDLLPEAQGKGQGKAMMNTFINKLIELEIPAVHLEVGKANPGAIQFYQRIGFHQIKEYEFSIAYGMKLEKGTKK